MLSVVTGVVQVTGGFSPVGGGGVGADPEFRLVARGGEVFVAFGELAL
jgi:hypothetical protein